MEPTYSISNICKKLSVIVVMIIVAVFMLQNATIKYKKGQPRAMLGVPIQLPNQIGGHSMVFQLLIKIVLLKVLLISIIDRPLVQGQISESCISGFLTESEILETARECSPGTSDESLDSGNENNNCFKDRISNSNQGYSTRIIPQLSIACDGNLTGWQAAGDITGRSQEPLLQIWREVENEPGTYQTANGDILLGRCDGRDGLEEVSIFPSFYECALDRPVPVQRGDIVGLVLPRDRTSSFRLYFTDESVVNHVYNFHPLTVFPDTSQRGNRREYQDTAMPLITLKITRAEMRIPQSLATTIEPIPSKSATINPTTAVSNLPTTTTQQKLGTISPYGAETTAVKSTTNTTMLIAPTQTSIMTSELTSVQKMATATTSAEKIILQTTNSVVGTNPEQNVAESFPTTIKPGTISTMDTVIMSTTEKSMPTVPTVIVTASTPTLKLIESLSHSQMDSATSSSDIKLTTTLEINTFPPRMTANPTVTSSVAKLLSTTLSSSAKETTDILLRSEGTTNTQKGSIDYTVHTIEERPSTANTAFVVTTFSSLASSMTLDTANTGIAFGGENNTAVISVVGLVFIALLVVLIFMFVAMRRYKRKHSYAVGQPSATNPIVENITVVINMAAENSNNTNTEHTVSRNETSIQGNQEKGRNVTNHMSRESGNEEDASYTYVPSDNSSTDNNDDNAMYSTISTLEDSGYYEVPRNTNNTYII